MHVFGVVRLTGKNGSCIIVVDEDVQIHTHVRALRRQSNNVSGSSISRRRASLANTRILSGTKVFCNLQGGKVLGWRPAPLKEEQILVFEGKKHKPSFQGSMHQVVTWVREHEMNLRDLTLKKKGLDGEWHEMVMAGFKVRI